MQWIKWVVVGLLVMIVSGLGVREWRSSQVVGHSQYRFNMAVIEGDSGVTFVSFDPAEKAILALPFPTDLAITSRSIGEYSIASLYKLGSYKGDGGKFVRQKIQGFMRVPVPGYLVVKGNLRWGLLKAIIGASETSLTRYDAILLLYRANRYRWRLIGEDELVRAGVIDNKIYHPDRLQEYVGSRLFDWGIGGSGVTIAIVNESGENGLGSDMADFLSNLGLDVVMVRSGNGKEILEKSDWQVESNDEAEKLGYIFENLFGLNKPKLEKVGDEYRARVLIRVGKDGKELF
jgi:hypothetical protein